MKTTIAAALTAVSLVVASTALAQTAPDHRSGGRSEHRHFSHARPSHAHRTGQQLPGTAKRPGN